MRSSERVGAPLRDECCCVTAGALRAAALADMAPAFGDRTGLPPALADAAV